MSWAYCFPRISAKARLVRAERKVEKAEKLVAKEEAWAVAKAEKRLTKKRLQADAKASQV